MSLFNRKAQAVVVTSNEVFVAFFDRSGGFQGSASYSDKAGANVARADHAELEARMGDVLVVKYDSYLAQQRGIRRS